MSKNITVEFTNERIIPSGGLAVVGAILGKSDFVKNCNKSWVQALTQRLVALMSRELRLPNTK